MQSCHGLAMPETSQILVVFDTNCVLCSAWIRFLLRHERRATMRFASVRKPTGKAIAAEHGFTPKDLDLSYLVIRDGQALTKSDASLALTSELKAPWNWLGGFRFVPRRMRDRVYDLVARNRLRWFGEQTDCFLPTAEQRSRFVDEMPVHEKPALGSK